MSKETKIYYEFSEAAKEELTPKEKDSLNQVIELLKKKITIQQSRMSS